MPSLRHQRRAPRPVLYLHRGGYVRPITLPHCVFLSWLVRTTGCEVTVPLYPLAPESTCTDTLAWVHAVHAQLATRHAPPAALHTAQRDPFLGLEGARGAGIARAAIGRWLAR